MLLTVEFIKLLYMYRNCRGSKITLFFPNGSKITLKLICGKN